MPSRKNLWLKVDSRLTDHLKIRDLASRLNIPDCYAAGIMVNLWGYILNLDSEAGKAGDISSLGDGRRVELALRWPGTPGTLVDNLIATGLIKKDQDPVTRKVRLYIANWGKFYDGFFKKRDDSRLRMQNKRDRDRPKRAKRARKTQNPKITQDLRVTYANVAETPLRSNTASASGAVEASAPSPATAARADQPPTDDPRLPVDAEFYEQLQRDTDAVHASFAQPTKTHPSPKPLIAPQGCAAQQPNPPASNLPARAPQPPSSYVAPFLSQPIPSAPEPTAPVAEIVEKAGLTLNKVIDLFRTGHYGQVIRVNREGRQLLAEVLDEPRQLPVTVTELDEAFSRAYEYHLEKNGKLGGRVTVYSKTMAGCLQTICHEREQNLRLQENIVGVVRGEQLANQPGTPLAKLGGGLTRQEAAKVRSDAKLMEFALRKDKENKEREARKKLQAAKEEL